MLEDAGFQVVVPRQSLCCGRPLYDFGMLDTAKGLLREILDTLRPEIEAGTPVVGLEPSCVAVFRDELMNLFPMDEDAKRLCGQHVHPERVPREEGARLPAAAAQAQGARPEALPSRARHEVRRTRTRSCKKLGLDFELLDSGCCGMAGSFGFESEHYDVSVAVGERVLLPAVREADDDTLIIADGFSCREQIAGLTDRGALHLAQVHPDGAARRARGPARAAARDGTISRWASGSRRRRRPLAAVAVGVGVLAGARPGLGADPDRPPTADRTSSRRIARRSRHGRAIRDIRPSPARNRRLTCTIDGVQVYARKDEQGKPPSIDAIDQDERKIRDIADRL